MLFSKGNYVSCRIIFVFVAFLSSSLSAADPVTTTGSYESVEHIKSVVKDFVTQNIPIDSDESIGVQINSIDVSAQLPVCSSKIDAAFPDQANKERATAISLTCNGDKHWQTFVPVSIQMLAKVVVAKRAIFPNESMTDSDLEYAQYDINHLYSGYFRSKEELNNQVASQLISAGSVVTKKNIRQALLIHKNQLIDLVARVNSVQVVMKGIAKSDGCMNDAIKAYNPSSSRTLDAVVVGSNRAEIVS